MSTVRKVAIFGASGNFGTPITAALTQAGYDITIITRTDSTSTFPPGIPIIRTTYTPETLTQALRGQDAAVCVVGPPGISHQTAMLDAAVAAGVQRFIVDDFGWGPDVNSLPEFDEVHAIRRGYWDHAKRLAEGNPGFTWTGISIGNPIDWAMSKFPTMGFDIAKTSATIYDHGEEHFTGTTLAGIGQSVAGVLRRPEQTANRFVRTMSIETSQRELLGAFEKLTARKWGVHRRSTRDLMEDGRRMLREGDGGWRLCLVVAQLYDEGEGRGMLAATRGESDADLLGVAAETAEQVVLKALELHQAR